MERIRVAGMEVHIENKGNGAFDVALVLPVFGKKSAVSSAAELKAMRDAIDRALAGTPLQAARPAAAPVRR